MSQHDSITTTELDRINQSSNQSTHLSPYNTTSRPSSFQDNNAINSAEGAGSFSINSEKKVTLRSERSLRRTLPPNNDPILDSVHGGRPQPLSVLGCLKAVLFATKLNVLLVFVPLGIIAAKLHWSKVAIFILNFIAIIPLAKLLTYTTEETALRLGEIPGAILNGFFANAVELIIAIIALKENEIDVVQAAVLGSVLSNLLLVLGLCFVFGGYKYASQTFNQTAAQTSASLLSLSCLSLLIPAAFHATATEIDQTSNIRNLSYGTSIVLLAVYVLYLVFQLKTHNHLYSVTCEEEEEPILPLWLSVMLLIVITVLVVVCADYMMGSMDGLTAHLSPTFIGLILLPIVSNAAEHYTAISVAMKNKMDLAIGVAVGSSMQVALFITPLLVILGWIIDRPMTLFFNTFETCVLFVSVLIVNYLIQDGESNWLEGAMLLSTYLIVAVAVYFYPAAAIATPQTPHR